MVPNNTDVGLIANAVIETNYSMAQMHLMALQRKLIERIGYLEGKRDYKNGNYKYVTTEGEGDEAVSTTWYSWTFMQGDRKTATMEGLVQMDLDRDAEREEERLPDDPQITPSTYYQKRIPPKCRLINYPDDLLPMTDEEKEAWDKLKQVQNDIKNLNEKYGVTDEEDEENSNNEDLSEQ